jgi:LmbE family N-acetylglucosaminyl deacetylase
MPDPLAPLLGRTLVLAAHPDDEAVGCGVLLQRVTEPHVAYLTDGAPLDRYFWKDYGSREEYAAQRRGEAGAACALVGGTAHFCDVTDQRLFRELERAQAWLDLLVARLRPHAIVAPAFEGGHPDHDAVNLLASIAGAHTGAAAWEYPCYHRSVDGALVHQEFRTAAGNEVVLTPAPAEWDRKLRMYGAYASQREVLQHFLAQGERFRPLAAYDYAAPPHAGVLNYEAWQWGITGSEVAEAFAAHRRRFRTTTGASSYSH